MKAGEVGQGVEVAKAGVGDGGGSQAQVKQLRHVLEVFQASVGDLGFADGQMFESGESGKMFQGGIADLGAIQVQPFELEAVFEALDAGVGDLRVLEGEVGEVGKGIEDLEVGIGDARVVVEEDLGYGAGLVGGDVGAKFSQGLGQLELIGISVEAEAQENEEATVHLTSRIYAQRFETDKDKNFESLSVSNLWAIHRLPDGHAEEEFDVAAGFFEFAEE